MQSSSTEEVGEKGGRAALLQRLGKSRRGSGSRLGLGLGPGLPRSLARVRDGFVEVVRQVECTLAPKWDLCDDERAHTHASVQKIAFDLCSCLTIRSPAQMYRVIHTRGV